MGLFRNESRQSRTQFKKRSTIQVNEQDLNAMRAILRKSMQRTAELENRVSALRRDVNRIDRRAYSRDESGSPIIKG